MDGPAEAGGSVVSLLVTAVCCVGRRAGHDVAIALCAAPLRSGSNQSIVMRN